MFTVIKRMEISASHKLVLPYRSKCASLHGHNWIITVYCRSSRLNSEGMVVDFRKYRYLRERPYRRRERVNAHQTKLFLKDEKD